MITTHNTSNNPTKTRFARPAVLRSLMVLALVVAFGPVTLSAATRDRTKPTVPGNFRVTARTAFSVSLAWSPSSDNSGNFTYVLGAAYGAGTVTLPKTATSYTFTGLYPRNTYWFTIQAVDAAGNYSAPIGTNATTLADTTPPSVAPVLAVTDVGSSYISLSWTPAQDDGPFLFYQILVDGAPYADAGTNLSANVTLLDPETTYVINVRAHDYGGNWSPLSEPVTVTTEPINTNDTTPPTTPGNLTDNGMSFQDGETWLFWEQSTDNVDPQSVIRYDVYVNGVLDQSLAGASRTILYGNPGVPNTFEVIAVDTAGNPSAPATLTTHP